VEGGGLGKASKGRSQGIIMEREWRGKS
jgi:hypothetical protein